MKKYILIVFTLVIVGVLAACGNNNEDDVSANNNIDSENNESELVIGASLLTASHPFQNAIKDALENEADNLNVSLEVSIANQDLNRQISSIEDFVNKEVDAIILTPVDSDGVTGAIMKAQDAGIPVITVDVKANDVEVESHIATDNYAGGMIAAESMAKYLDEAGEIALITYPEVQSVRDRIDGFKEQAEKYPDLEIVKELPGRTREEAKSASEDMLTSEPNLKGIFGFGDDMALAATSAISERDSSAIVVGFDGLEEAINGVDDDNAFYSVVVQYPDKMGEEAMKNAVELAKGNDVESEVPITPGLYVHDKGFVDVEIDGKDIKIAE